MILARSISVARRRTAAELVKAGAAAQQGSGARNGGAKGGVLGLASAAACAVALGALASSGRPAAKCREAPLVPLTSGLVGGNGLVELLPTAQVGAGSFGTVRLGKHKPTNERVAVKIVDETERTRDVLDAEINALERIERAGGHNNVVRFKCALSQPKSRTNSPELTGEVAGPVAEWVEAALASVIGEAKAESRAPADEATHERWLLFEHVQGEELYDRVVERGAMRLDQARDIARQVACALEFLHEKAHVAHADIKPENILVSGESDVKVIDFGSALPLLRPGQSKELCDQAMTNMSVGTAAYCAPEILQGHGHLTTAIDVWALGCVLYILVCSAHPFDPRGTRSDSAVMKAVSSNAVEFSEAVWSTDAAAPARDLVGRMLEKDPAARISLAEVLAHPFFTCTSSTAAERSS